MSLELIAGNRMERLLEELVRELRCPLIDPLAVEIIIVHGPAMQRWLALQLARKLGICANTRFDYPNAILADLVRRVLPDGEISPFEPDLLTWKILQLLPDCKSRPEFAPVAAYLQQATPRMNFQLASRIAAAFDQYLIYRPDMIETWQAGRLTTAAGQEEAWQAHLWCSLVSGFAETHRLDQTHLFFEALDKNPELRGKLPERLSIFGISYLPPFHLRFFNRLSAYIPVRMYVPNPCCEYWGDIVTQSRAARLSGGDDPEKLYLEQGHPLLAAWGAHGRDFFNLAADLNLPMRECFEVDLPPTMLGRLQSDILQLIDRSRSDSESHVFTPNDRSIQVHSCHSPTRELEVLRDRLLDMFSAEPELRAEDVLVLTPDMEHYAPCIQAVFGMPDGVEIPFSIADRSLAGSGSMLNAFQALLRLPATRMHVSDVLPILECAAVQRCFGLSQEDIETVQEWIGETHICWALDADDRREDGQPADSENTWRFGLNRMLLGYAMDEDDGMFAGALPFDGMQGEAALLAGVLAELIDQLARLKRVVAAERTLADWHAVLQNLLQSFFEPASEDEHVWRRLQQCLDRLLQIQKHADFDGPVAFDMLLEALDKELERSRHPAGFFSGAVTFAEMQPMRGIPFRVICLIGMNDRAFPRQTFPPGFNLISQSPRMGDRDQAKDDRYVFLEALLAARDMLYISYTGQSQQDNAPLPPSVLVSELLDALEATNRAEDSALLKHIVFEHSLQAFNTKYFIPGAPVQSYSAQYCDCARASTQGPAAPPDFFETVLPELQEAESALSLDELVRFFKNPSAYLLRERLNVSLEPQVFSITERESFQLGGLERYGVEQALLQEFLVNSDAEGSFEHCAARGILPHGAAGHAAYLQSLQSVKKFVSDLNRSSVISEGTESRLLEIAFDDCTLSASVSLAADASLVRMRHAAIKPIDFIRVWLEYLIVCSAPDIGNPSAILAGLDQKKREQTRLWNFNPVEDPHTELKKIIDLYHEGLRSPLAFMPQASFAYAEALNTGKSPQQASAAAAKSLEHGDFKNSELDDVCFGRFFDESIVESSDFERCARQVFGPILQHRQKKM